MQGLPSLPLGRRALYVVVVASLVSAGLSAGCRSRSRAILQETAAPVATGTVQAPLPDDAATDTAPAVVSTAPVTQVTPPPSTGGANGITGATTDALPQKKTKAAPKGFWPAKVGSFSVAFKGPVWYPKFMPAGYAMDTLDVVELDPGSGLVCDAEYVNTAAGEKVVSFLQGSPKGRSYDIVSVGKVPWGTAKADMVHQDPTDNTTPIDIVYSSGGNFAELTGDVPLSELKAIAASMVAVK